MSNQHKVIDIETDTVSDFSIMVTYLPKTSREKDIKEFFETQFPGVQVAQVCLAYDVEALTEAKLALVALQHDLAEALTSKSDETQLKPIKDSVTKQEQNIAAIKQQIRADHEKHFTGVAFVTFEHIHMARRITELYEMRPLRWVLNGFKYKLKYSDGSLLKVRWAPEAEEVIWENLNYSFRQRMKKRAITILVTLLVLGVSFGIIFGFKYLNHKAKKSFKGAPIEITRADGVKEKRYPGLSSSQTTQLELIAIAIWLTCKIVNKIFDRLLVKLTKMEKHHSYGDFDMSAVIKTVIAQFLNTSCLIVIVHVIVNSSELYYIWGAGGLIGDIWTILIGNSIVLPLLNLLNFGFIAKLIKRCKLKDNKKNKAFTQKQAHEIMEGVPMDPIRSYTDIYQVLLTSCFFVPVFPANALFHFGTLACIYWIQKIYLLRFYSRPRLLQHTLGLATLRFIKVAAFLISAGELVFDAILRPEVQVYFIIQTVVTGILIFLPIEDALLKFYSYSGEKAEIKKHQKYSQINHKFGSDYPRENPLTSEEATEAHIEHLKGLLSAEQAPPQPQAAVASEQA